MKKEPKCEALDLAQLYGGVRATNPDDSHMWEMLGRPNIDVEVNPL